MKKISILMLEQSMPTAIVSFTDLFQMACFLWDDSPDATLNSPFDIELVSKDGKPIKYSKHVEIKPDRGISEVNRTDLIMVPSSGYDMNTIGSYPRETLDWIKFHNQNGTDIAGVCTGVFLLAEAGILDGKRTTTHWALADWFQKKYPKTILTPEKIITEDGNIFCSGGGSAGFDLCLHLIEKYCGHKIATRCAKILLLERCRDVQTPFEMFNYQKNHRDSDIIKAQEWIENCYPKNCHIDDIAAHVGMSIRNFKRRFKKATGDSPLVYLQRLRIDAAKDILEKRNSNIEEIAHQVGYDDMGFFRKLFVRHTGVSPSIYRQRFKRGTGATTSGTRN